MRGEGGAGGRHLGRTADDWLKRHGLVGKRKEKRRKRRREKGEERKRVTEEVEKKKIEERGDEVLKFVELLFLSHISSTLPLLLRRLLLLLLASYLLPLSNK